MLLKSSSDLLNSRHQLTLNKGIRLLENRIQNEIIDLLGKKIAFLISSIHIFDLKIFIYLNTDVISKKHLFVTIKYFFLTKKTFYSVNY